MMKGAIFGSKHSVDDYRAIMNYARITTPTVKENYVDIPGGNSSLDLTEAVSGVTFNDGQISFKFTFLKEEDRSSMKNDLHGKKLQIVLEKEPEYYYDGRLFCRDGDYAGQIFELYIDARVSPYKQERQMTLHTEEITAAKDILLYNDRMPSIPVITVKGNISLTYNGISVQLSDGTYTIPEFTLLDGLNRVYVDGKGSLELQYRKGKIV
ncbi:MAG: hypothetical protein HDP34_04390 [Clostridia bacterium]|nr:hypothetical protein [Clostridia bacterium]